MTMKSVPEEGSTLIAPVVAFPKEDSVRDAERAFVLKDYRRALDLASEVLSAENETLRRSLCDDETDSVHCVRLQTTRVRFESDATIEFPMVIRLSPDIALEDRAAVVALQSLYELTITETTNCGTSFVFEWYRRHVMPLPVALLWIEFAFSTFDEPQSSVEMAAELLHCIMKRPDVQDFGCSRDLLLLFLTDMMPYCDTETYTHDVLNRILASSWSSTSSFQYKRARKASPKAISVVLARLGEFSRNFSVDACRQMLERQSTETVKEASSKTEMDLVNDVSCRQDIINWKRLVAECKKTDWRELASTTLRNRVVMPLFESNDRWKNRGCVAISAFLCFIAWKKRRTLMVLPLMTASTIHTISFMAKLFTAPIHEVLEALIPRR